MRDLLYVAIGGALGALARYSIGLAAGQVFGKGFPWGTLTVNVVGCFLMGIVLALLADFQARGAHGQYIFWYKAVAVGFLGGLTTFSSFGADTIKALQAAQPTAAFANVAANVVLSLSAVWSGLWLMAIVD